MSEKKQPPKGFYEDPNGLWKYIPADDMMVNKDGILTGIPDPNEGYKKQKGKERDIRDRSGRDR